MNILNFIAYIVLTILYFLFLIKLICWKTLKRFGYSIEIPYYYIIHSEIYDLICFLLFSLSIVFAFFQSFSPNWILIIIPIFLFFISQVKGRNKAVKILREILVDIYNNTDDKLEKKKIENDLALNNLSLFNKYIKLWQILRFKN
ncbi:hypothetical protein AMJ80_02955 [bacterium SM23_31]|nr:MAG: hypothetical protein AMJ80_02955 [bacterium SM23_31]